jgi:DNA-binding NarL/FixJ family response regulator
MSSPIGRRHQMLERLGRGPGTNGQDGAAAAEDGDARLRREPITVLVADADEIVRLGVRAALGGDRRLRVVGDADSAGAAVGLAARLRPTIVVAGSLPDGGLLHLCGRLRDTSPATRVVILARGVDGVSVVDAVRAGAAGYFTTHPGRDELCRAMRAVAAGEILIDPASTRVLLNGIRQGTTPGGPAALTTLAAQERRVLALVAQGKTNKEIAAALKLSDKTVKNYLSHAFEKLNVTRRAHAAVLFSQASGAPRLAI